MKAVYNGITVDFEIRAGSTDGNLIKKIWYDDCYRLKPLKKEHPEIKTILEVGGHIGVFSVLASLLWPQSEIRVYEAWKENYHLLSHHCQAYANIHLFNKAVIGWCEESVAFRISHLSYGNTGDGRVDNRYMDNAHFCEGEIKVDACTITEALDGWDTVDLLKLDCEGSEIPILESLERHGLLGRIRWIHGEWHGGDRNRDRIKLILAETHKTDFTFTKNTYGLFWSESR